MISQFSEQWRRIVVSGMINEDTAAKFLEQVTALECMDISKPITVYIDTYGGNVDSALLMYDTIKSCCCPIVTLGIGKVMSAGTLILAAGDKGARFITENTRVMIHEVAGGVFGTVSEMQTNVSEVKRLQNIYVDLFSKDTGTSKKKILQDMKQDFYMSAEEAVKYGIVDKLVPTRKTLKKVTSKPPSKK